MIEFVFLCGVSGAGKSSGLRAIRWQSPTQIVALDKIIETLHAALSVDKADAHPYSYRSWERFLLECQEDPSVTRAFREEIDSRRHGSDRVVLEGNHFVLPEVTNTIVAAVQQDWCIVAKLFLDISREDVLRQRRQRNNEWDRDATLKTVGNEVQRARNSLRGQGFSSIRQDQLESHIVSSFGS